MTSGNQSALRRKGGYCIGIDLGGNWIKCGLFDAGTGRMLERQTLPTRDGKRTRGLPAFAATIREFVKATEKERGKAQAAGVAAPGLTSRDNRCIDFMPGRLQGLEGLAWEELLGRPAACLNDAHAAMMGEAWQGAAKGLRDVFLLTLGTGVGGAILTNGELLQGHIGRAGHLGHICLDADGPPTITGTPGGLEWFVGNATVAERTGGRFQSTAELTESVRRGDKEAAQEWKRSIRHLACGIASLVNVLDPEAVIVGGGIATVGALLFNPLRKELAKVEWRPGGRQVRILPAKLGEWAGSYGAAHFACRKEELGIRI